MLDSEILSNFFLKASCVWEANILPLKSLGFSVPSSLKHFCVSVTIVSVCTPTHMTSAIYPSRIRWTVSLPAYDVASAVQRKTHLYTKVSSKLIPPISFLRKYNYNCNELVHISWAHPLQSWEDFPTKSALLLTHISHLRVGNADRLKTLCWRVGALHTLWAHSPNFLLNISSFKTSNSSEYHTFYLKTAYNMQSQT